MPITKGLIIKCFAASITVAGAAIGGFLIQDRFDFLKKRFGIPRECFYSEGCDINDEQIKKIKFKDLDDESSEWNIEGLSGKSIKLRVADEEDEKSYPGNKKYIFDNSSNTDDVKITHGDKSLTISKKTESWFRGEGYTLALANTKLNEDKNEKMKEINDELEKLGLGTLKLSISDFNGDDSVKFNKKEKDFDGEALKKIKFEELGGVATKIIHLDSGKKIKVGLHYDENSAKYPKNMKFIFSNDSTSYDVKIEGLQNKNVVIKRATATNTPSNEEFKTVNGKLKRPQ